METPAYIRDQHVVGGNLALDFLNTQNGPAGGAPEDDVIRDYDDLLAWSHVLGDLTDAEADRLQRAARQHPDAAKATLERALATRTYLYDLFHVIASGGTPAREDVARLERDEAEALGHGSLVATDAGYRWTWASAENLDLGRPVWAVIHAATTLLTNGPLDRVKGCALCRFHFLDESKNRSRRWCSMGDCGTRTKARRYVARRAAARSSAAMRSGADRPA
jgi:predicted RNA-binding Zn ribbon-like protein